MDKTPAICKPFLTGSAHYIVSLHDKAGLAMQGMVLICMARPVSDKVKIETQSDWGYSLGVGEWKGATGHIAGKNVDPLTPWGTE